MKKMLLVAALVVGLSMTAFVGCKKSSDVSSKGDDAPPAITFQDGAQKFFDYQYECPVDGGKPLDPDLYVDVDGKRIYFDSQECVDEFKNNQEEYVQKLEEQVESTMGAGSPDM